MPVASIASGRNQVSDRRNCAATAVLLLAAAALASGGAAAAASDASPPMAPPRAVPQTSATAPPPPAWHLLQNRCSKCHNSVDWAGGIAFDTMSPQQIPEDAQTWEAAVQKLQGRLMPPPGNPQPDQHTVDAFVSWLQGRLDRAGAAHPDPGF